MENIKHSSNSHQYREQLSDKREESIHILSISTRGMENILNICQTTLSKVGIYTLVFSIYSRGVENIIQCQTTIDIKVRIKCTVLLLCKSCNEIHV